jgi:hypothetical protein
LTTITTKGIRSSLNQSSGTWRLILLYRLACSPPLQASQCITIQHPERTPTGRTAHGRNQDKPVSLFCLAPTIER